VEKYILMGGFWALTAFTYFACYKFGYYSGRLVEFKETRKWLDGLLEEAEKREAIKNAVTKPAVEKK
jgi:hypothetical protein